MLEDGKSEACCRTQETRPGTLRSRALPHGSALHLQITCRLLLCVGLGMSRDRCCGHHAAETPLYDWSAVRVPNDHSLRNVKKVFIARPLHRVQVAAVRAARHESRPLLRAPRGGDDTSCLYCCTGAQISLCPESNECLQLNFYCSTGSRCEI